METGKALTIVVYNEGSNTISIEANSSWKSLDGYTFTCGANKFLEISLLKYNTGGTKYLISVKGG